MQNFVFRRQNITISFTKQESFPVAELFYEWLQEENQDGSFNGEWCLQDQDETFLLSNSNCLFAPDDFSPEQLKKFDKITAALTEAQYQLNGKFAFPSTRKKLGDG